MNATGEFKPFGGNPHEDDAHYLSTSIYHENSGG